MFCTDFIFDNERLSDNGFIICNFDGSESSWSGGEVTFNTIKSPGSNNFTYYTSSYESPISFTFSICKNPCKVDSQEEMYLTQDDQSYIMRWLQKIDGYRWFAFDQDGWEDVWFNVQINLTTHYLNGHVIGYDLVCTADSPYGYSQQHRKEFTLSNGSIDNEVEIKNYSDIVGSIYPKMTITPLGNGTIRLRSGSTNNQKITGIENAVKNSEIILDKNNDVILGIANMNNFNYEFPIMSNEYKDIRTRFANIGEMDIKVKIEYRFIRRVTV